MPSRDTYGRLCAILAAGLALSSHALLILVGLTAGGPAGALVATLAALGVVVAVRGSLEASSVLGVAGVVSAGLSGVSGALPGVALAGFSLSLPLSWTHSDACDRGLRLLAMGVGTGGYAFAFSWVLHRWGVYARFLPAESVEALSTSGGFTVMVVVSTVFFSLAVYYAMRPGSSLPPVSLVAEWLYRNRAAPLEVLVYSLLLASSRASPFLALLSLASVGLGVWAWSLTRRREVALLTATASYALLTWLTGYYWLVNDYLLRLLQ